MGDMADFVNSSMPLEVPSFKKCAYCNRGGLQWGLTSRGWRLFNSSGEIHICSAYKGKNETN